MEFRDISPFTKKYEIKENDEAPHFINDLEVQEWWYFNGFFNKSHLELENCSFTISFGHYPKNDSLKIIFHNRNGSNQGGIYLFPSGSLKAKSNKFDIQFSDSYAKGNYPNWQVYAENNKDKNNFSLNFTFKANSLPVWIFSNTGRNLTTSPIGYYSVLDCKFNGELTIKNKSYQVTGKGYHEHFWTIRNTNQISDYNTTIIDINVWDWSYIQLENGWNLAYVKLHNSNRADFSRFIPGSMLLELDGKNIIESVFYTITYDNLQNTSIDTVELPTNIRVRSIFFRNNRFSKLKTPFIVDIVYKMDDICECLCGSPPAWGQWESTGTAIGTVIQSGKSFKINGLGVMEITNKF